MPFGVMDAFIILIVVMVSWAYMYAKTYQTAHMRYAQLIACQLQFNKNIFYKFIFMDQT